MPSEGNGSPDFLEGCSCGVPKRPPPIARHKKHDGIWHDYLDEGFRKHGHALHHLRFDVEDPSLSSFPFYITQKSGVRSLDHSKFFDAFAIVLERNRAFYMQAFAETGPATLKGEKMAHVSEIYGSRRDTRTLLQNQWLLYIAVLCV